MNKWAEILIGLALIIIAVLIGFYSQTWTIFGKDLNLLHAAWILLKGGIFWLVILIGLLFLLLGISDLKE